MSTYPPGTLVWVRRRNGSWWPGRVLGDDEHVPPPTTTVAIEAAKTGTPVKLLGKEDASVEWFNLERSIRVKAFRCGEFDDCIERVEASEDVFVKRREKYARREDAILHALEIEKKQYKAGLLKSKMSRKVASGVKKKINSSSDNHGSKYGSADCSRIPNHKSQMLSRAVVSIETDDKGVEEAVPETVPRTRGLQEFGLRIAPPKKKHIEFVTWDRLQKPIDNHVDGVSCSGRGAGHAGKRRSSIPIKRKGSMSERSPARRRDRRRPLHRVLESSAKLTPFHSIQSDHDVSITPVHGEKDTMGAICRAKRSRCFYLSADALDHEEDSFKEGPTTQSTIATDQHYCGPLADGNTSSVSAGIDSDSPERDYSENKTEDENLQRENPGTHGRYSDPLELCHTSNEVGVSKWHMKGKRNIRNISKNSTKLIDGTIANVADKDSNYVEGASCENKVNGFKMRIDHSSHRVLGHNIDTEKELDACDGGDFISNDASNTQTVQLGNQQHPSVLRTEDSDSLSVDSDEDSQSVLHADWEADRPYHVDHRPYWKEPECSVPNDAEPLEDEMEAMLVEINLEVQASYQGERVPLVSLMSRLNGKAIIGHPVQVEILDDGLSDRFFYIIEHNLDESSPPSPVWTTARTAIPRIPHSNPAPSALEGEGEGKDLEHLQGSYPESKPPMKKVYTNHFSHQARLAKKSISHARRSPSGKFQRKSVSFSGQKIRTLSSLSTEQKCSSENDDAKPDKSADFLDVLIKSEATGPLVTCIPVKVVFSRILEAFVRPASSVAHQVPVTGSPTKDPS